MKEKMKKIRHALDKTKRKERKTWQKIGEKNIWKAVKNTYIFNWTLNETKKKYYFWI